ncbi:MAG: hypothetical protein Q9161_005360 [Pseudevernia consocians]
MQSEKAWSWRVEHIPQGTTAEQLKSFFVDADQSRLIIESLVPEAIAPDLFIHAHASHYLTATISFRAQKGRKPQLIDDFEGKISLDADFYGFTSLYSSETDHIAAESVVVDANRNEELLPVRSFVFLGVPHRGLEIDALKTYVQGTPSERMIDDLGEGSSILEILDHDFEEKFRRSPVQILTCYELSPTPTVKKYSDGSVKRDGDPVIMVTKARALLGYEDTKIGVYLDHSQIAKIDLEPLAIDRAILENSEQQRYHGRFDIPRSGDASLGRSASAAPLLGDDTKRKTGLTPGLAEPPGRHESPNNTEGDKDSVTATGPRSSLYRPSPVGEDLPINSAIFDGDITRLRKLLNDANLDKPDSQGYTPLMVAAATDQEQVVDDLKRRGASLKPSRSEGDTAIHLACRHAGVAVVLSFLKHVEMLDIRGAEGRTPLMSSIQNPREDIAKRVLGSVDNVEASDDHKRTALHYAALEGKAEIVRLLIMNRKASQNATTRKYGWTPLHYAAPRRHAEVIELLGKNGTDCNTLTSKQDGARSAIHLVLLKKDLSSNGAECIRLLLRYGANIEQRDGAGRTPLHLAAQHGWTGRVKWLISNKAKLEAKTDDWQERTPLHIAVEGRHLTTTKALLDAGSDKDTAMRSPSGKTALHIATEGNNIDLVKEILARKANVSPIMKHISSDPCGYIFSSARLEALNSETTPLLMAIENNNMAIMSLLLEAGADVEGKGSEIDCVPLSIAVARGKLAAVRILLDHGADPERKVEVQIAGKKEIWRAGKYFEPDVSEENRRRIREMLR